MSYLKELAAMDKDAREKAAAALRRKKIKIRPRKKIRSFNLAFWKSLNSFVYVV